MATQQKPESTALTVAEQREAKGGIAALIEARRTRIEPFLPPGVTIERVMAAAYLAVKATPSLMECEPESLVLAIAKIQQWGLEIGVTAHLVPFGKKVTPVADYKGLVELVVASGAARAVESHVVYADEPFEYEQGLTPKLVHRPAAVAKDRGAMIGVYAIIRLRFGHVQLHYMPLEEVEAIRQTYSKSWKSGAMPTWYMRKTCVRQATKMLPKNPRLARALATIEDEEAIEYGHAEPLGGDPARTLSPGDEIPARPDDVDADGVIEEPDHSAAEFPESLPLDDARPATRDAVRGGR